MHLAYLMQSICTWPYNSILIILAISFNPFAILLFMLTSLAFGFISPPAITGDNIFPNLLLVLPNKFLYVLELLLGFEENIKKNSHQKHIKYCDFVRQQERHFIEVKYIELSFSALDLFYQLFYVCWTC